MSLMTGFERRVAAGSLLVFAGLAVVPWLPGLSAIQQTGLAFALAVAGVVLNVWALARRQLDSNDDAERERWQQRADALDHPLVLLDIHGAVLAANKAATARQLTPGLDAVGQLFASAPAVWPAIRQAALAGHGWFGQLPLTNMPGCRVLAWPAAGEAGSPLRQLVLELLPPAELPAARPDEFLAELPVAGLRVRANLVTAINDAALALLGGMRDQWLKRPLSEVFTASPQFEQALVMARGRAGSQTVETELTLADGRRLWCNVALGNGRDGLLLLVWDASDQKRRQERLRQAAVVFEAAGESILVLDEQRRIRMSNATFSRTSGYSANEVAGKPTRLLFSNRQPPELYEHIFAHVQRESSWQGEIWSRKKDGTVYPEWVSINAVRNERDEIVEYVVVASDITERKRSEERLNYQANYDPLTKLPNRTLFMDRLRQSIARSKREGTQLAVLFIDLDRFKTINDSMGHSAGDKLLVLVAKALGSCVRASDTIARFGGDEFAIILSPIYGPKNASTVAQTVLKVLAQTFNIDGHDCLVGGSIGISVSPSDGDDPEELLKDADAAMYRAKENGRNTYQFFTAEMQQQALARLSLERDLRYAIERQEFVLHFQPQQDLQSGRVAGLEVLVRWQSGVRGMVSPGEFISLAEENGQILQLGEWVLRAACRQYAQWHRDGLAPRYIAVNVSGRQFRSPGFPRLVQQVLEETQMPAHGLELELTESFLMQDEAGIMTTLNSLRDMGVSLSIDDFGTGYSSLSYLKRFPISTLKIDRSFVRDVPGDEEDVAIVAAIINMAKVLRLDTVAEGVETEQQLRFLRELGCGIVQGFYYSRPLPATECGDFLRAELAANRPQTLATSP